MGLSFGNSTQEGTGEFHLIHHLLYPKGRLVNDAIPEHLYSEWYMSFDKMVWLMQKCRIGQSLQNVTLSRPFACSPLIQMTLNSWGFAFVGQFYMDRV